MHHSSVTDLLGVRQDRKSVERWPLVEVWLLWTLDPLSDARNKAIASLYHLPRHQQIYPYFVWWYLKETRWRIIHLTTSSAWVARKWNFGSLKNAVHQNVGLKAEVKAITCQCSIGGNLVLSTGLIMWIGHRKKIWKLTFRALSLRRSESS